jgi:hypothetical protein
MNVRSAFGPKEQCNVDEKYSVWAFQETCFRNEFGMKNIAGDDVCP